jgi:hypothetical protein
MRSSSSKKPVFPAILFAFLAVGMSGCGGGGGDASSEGEAASSDPTAQETEAMILGPKDGADLPPTDIERVAVGSVAPDFSLRTLAGETVTLSDFRGEKNVILVFYRGHW